MLSTPPLLLYLYSLRLPLLINVYPLLTNTPPNTFHIQQGKKENPRREIEKDRILIGFRGQGQEMELSLNLGFAGFSSSDRVEKVPTGNVVRQGKGDFDYLRSLEEEMKKIEPFRRELPLCMILLETTVERFRKVTRNGTAEEAVTATPSIEWLFPLKRKSGDKELGEVSSVGKKRANSFDDGGLFKSGFARDDGRRKPVNLDCANDSAAEDHGGFLQSQKKSGSPQKSSVKRDNGCSLRLMSPTSVLANQAAANAKSDCSSKLIFGSSFVADQMKPQNKCHQQHLIQQQQNQGMFKKQRRAWSAELHRHFLDALEKLGGAQAATPKQIREMMKVQGLTNDEVKSHLQKYRLNIRRLPSPSEDPNSYNAALGKSNVRGEEDEEEYRENSDGHSWVTGLSEKLLVAS